MKTTKSGKINIKKEKKKNKLVNALTYALKENTNKLKMPTNE